MVTVAVATSDGINIDQHFGQARVFRLYRVEEGGSYRELEVRRISNAPTDAARVRSAETTVEQLADVDVVLAHQIGPHAVAGLWAHGIKSFTVKGSIDRALSAYGKRHKLLDEELPVVLGYRAGAGTGPLGRQRRRS